MPQCQRSRLILGPDHQVADHCWRCPGDPRNEACGGGECYLDVTTEQWAQEPFALALMEAKTEFGRPHTPDVRLWSGVRPQTVCAPDGVADVYLNPTAVPKWRSAQIAFQASHEAAHVVCGIRILHWTHEVAAVRFSLDHLARHGFQWYADVFADGAEEGASSLSTSDLLAWDAGRDEFFPDGLHDRAYLLGQQLVSDVGWPAVRELALWPDQTIDQWLQSLPAARRGAAERSLGL